MMQCAVAVFSVFVGSEVLSAFYTERKNDPIVICLSYIAAVIIVFVGMEITDVDVAYPLAVCGSMFVLLIGFATTYKRSIKLLVKLMIIILVGYMVLHYIMTPEYELTTVWIVFVAIEYISVKVYVAMWRSASRAKSTLFLILPTVMMVTIICVVSNAQMMLYQRNLLVLALVVAVVLMLIAYNVIVRKYENETEEQILAEQNRAYKKQLEVITESNEAMRLIRHDMKNHIIAIKQLIDKRDYDKLEQYIEGFGIEVESADNMVDTGNIELDAIINNKAEEMRRQDILLIKNIIIPENLKISGYDMSVIVGNLLDNAIRGVLKCQNRCIDLKMSYMRGRLCIIVSNSYEGEIAFDKDGIPLTSKQDNINHGLGMKNVRKTVQKYEGSMFVKAKDGMFSAEVELHI